VANPEKEKRGNPPPLEELENRAISETLKELYAEFKKMRKEAEKAAS